MKNLIKRVLFLIMISNIAAIADDVPMHLPAISAIWGILPDASVTHDIILPYAARPAVPSKISVPLELKIPTTGAPLSRASL